jgi:uncharacterized membrane protein
VTIDLQRSAEIRRSAAEVWHIVADYERDPEWRRGVVAMAPTPPGPVEVGTTTCEDIRFGGRRYRNGGRVLSLEPERSFAWETTSGIQAEGGRTVVPIADDRCVVELTLRVTPTGVERLLAPVLRRMLDRQLEGDLARLVALVADESSSGVS